MEDISMIRHSYNTNQYPFVSLLTNLYGADLTLLHQAYQSQENPTLGNDTHSDAHRIFYQKLKDWPEMTQLYRRFIAEVVSPLVGDTFLYQQFPSYRIQFPNSLAVTSFHYDADPSHRHPLGEVNWLLPLTEMRDTSAVWIESHPWKEDYAPMEGDPGDLIRFNGNTLKHGNKVNLTGKTRISMDFRTLTLDRYREDNPNKSATSGKRFVIGEYYQLYP